MGRHNHENSVAIPGYGQPVVLSGDDSFVTTPAQSQVYSYIAAGRGRGVERPGRPLGVRLRHAGVNDYYDFTPGSPAS